MAGNMYEAAAGYGAVQPYEASAGIGEYQSAPLQEAAAGYGATAIERPGSGMIPLPPPIRRGFQRRGLPPMPMPARAALRSASPMLSGLGGLGEVYPWEASAGVGEQAPIDPVTTPMRSTLALVWSLASLAGTAVGAYHGYKRNDSVGWAIGWGLLGGLFPIIVIPVAFAQGIGEPKE